MRARSNRAVWRRWAVVALLVLGGAAPAGCGNPCETLSEKTCEKVGEGAEPCRGARKRAAGASSTEREICRRALKYLEIATAE